jgi:PleD family two-component response regulator
VPSKDLSAKRLVEAADQTLYRAKAKGRNRIEINSDPFSQPADADI